MHAIEFILYVKDEGKSTEFYKLLLCKQPIIDVPGMTEFQLAENCILGLMPNDGIAKQLGDTLPHPVQKHYTKM